jgi:hypothetical protein
MFKHRDFVRIVDSTINHNYESNSCFLCSTLLNEDNKTEEHVFPKWLQKKFNLWDQELGLVNRTYLKYRDLKIPCCKECNNNLLSGLEIEIKNSVDQGYERFILLDEFKIFRWISKIFLGIIYKELFLHLDRKNPDSGTIMDEELLKKYRILHLWSQLDIQDNKEFCPGSIFIFRSQKPTEINKQFDLIDDALNGVICIRMADIFLVADFLENGIHKKSMGGFLDKYKTISLHPDQCRELGARIIYKASLLELKGNVELQCTEETITLKYTIDSTADENFYFREWNQEHFAHVLSFYTGLQFEDIFKPPDLVWTLLHDDNNNLRELPPDSEFLK